MLRQHFVPLQIDQCQCTINPKNTFNRFVTFQTLIDIIYLARIQRNSTRYQKVTVSEIFFFKFTHFSLVTPCYDWVKSKLQKVTRNDKKVTVP